MASSSKKRVHLSLETKVKVINQAKSDSQVTVRSLAETFGCGRTQISDILKNKESILLAYESNASTCKKRRASKFGDVNEALYQWYRMACSKNIYPCGPQLCAKAKEIAVRLGVSNFEGTNGWLEKWKTRYNVKKVAISGESGDVSGATVSAWKERLPEILRGYSKKDVYNIDETGCFWRALPTHGFAERGKQCSGGKKSKQRFTIAFLVNAAGEKEKPIVIWKSANPRCFRRFDKSLLPVRYYNQPKAWMTGEILDTYLTTFNSKLRAEKRSILLFMDNAGCHPEHLRDKYSNIKIVFLPANTTSKLQPLDLGVIANFKTHYRRLLLQHVLAKIDNATKATDVTSSINVLIAIRWVALAWKEVKGTTIIKCFKKAGILSDTLDIQESICSSEDPFEDVDEAASLAPLISAAMGTQDACSVSDYVNGDSELPVCTDLDNDHWEDNFMDSLTQENTMTPTEEDSDPESDVDLDPPVPVIKDFKEAIQTLEHVQDFLESRNCLEMATKMSALLTEVAAHQVSAMHQTTLTQFFSRAEDTDENDI